MWEQVRPFLKDLQHVSGRFGLVVAGRHRGTGEWLGLADLLSLTRTPSGRGWLERCVLRVYTGADYLPRWRRVFADRLGFSVIPDRDQEQPTAHDGSGSPAQLLSYLGRTGVSSADLAVELGVSRSLLSQYLTGRKTWTGKWQERVATWMARRVDEKR